MFLTATIISKQMHPSLVGYLTLFSSSHRFSNSDIYTHPHSRSAMGSAACIICVQSTHVSLFHVHYVSSAFFLAEYFVYSFACLY